MPEGRTYWLDYEKVDHEFEHWWMSRAKEAPFISATFDFELVPERGMVIDLVKEIARYFFHSGYEQRRREEKNAGT